MTFPVKCSLQNLNFCCRFLNKVSISTANKVPLSGDEKVSSSDNFIFYAGLKTILWQGVRDLMEEIRSDAIITDSQYEECTHLRDKIKKMFSEISSTNASINQEKEKATGVDTDDKLTNKEMPAKKVTDISSPVTSSPVPATIVDSETKQNTDIASSVDGLPSPTKKSKSESKSNVQMETVTYRLSISESRETLNGLKVRLEKQVNF